MPYKTRVKSGETEPKNKILLFYAITITTRYHKLILSYQVCLYKCEMESNLFYVTDDYDQQTMKLFSIISSD